MFRYPVKLLTLFICFAAGTGVSAQTTSSASNPLNGKENNPYTKYGLGELMNPNSTVLRGMADISSAYANAYRINSDNPASYSFLQRTTYEVGAYGVSRTVQGTIAGEQTSYKTGTATIAYMNFAVPVKNIGGFSFGFRPYSRVYYSLVDSLGASSSPVLNAAKWYWGEGALQNAYIGGSAKYKGLSVGINVAYLFGTINRNATLVPKNDTSIDQSFRTDYSTYTRVGGINWKAGIQYETKLDSTHYIRIGGTLALSQGIKQHLNEYHITSYTFSDTIARDTSLNTQEAVDKMIMPTQYSIGIMIGRLNKWSVGLDYRATNWSQFNSKPDSSMNLGVGTSSYKMSIGSEYTPDINNTKNYFARATYRLGAYYGKDYLQIGSQTLPYYGITAGMSFPFRRSFSQLHIALDAGQLGTTQNGLMKQNYFRFTVGLSLNDLWFIKRKYD